MQKRHRAELTLFLLELTLWRKPRRATNNDLDKICWVSIIFLAHLSTDQTPPHQSSRSREECKPIVQMKLKYVKETDRAEDMNECLETEHVMTKSASNSAWGMCSKSLANGSIVFGSLTFEFHIYFPLLFGKLCPRQIIHYNQSFLLLLLF